MGAHEPDAVLGVLSRSAKELRMDQVDRADIEACRDADRAAERDHPFGEIEARTPVIETAVDMRRLDVEKGARADRFGEALKEAHGEGRPLPMPAAQEFAIERGEVGSHRGDATGGRAARSMRAGKRLAPAFGGDAFDMGRAARCRRRAR